MWDFASPVIMYWPVLNGVSWHGHDNTVYNSGANPHDGFVNYNKMPGTLGPNNNVVTRPPPVPTQPARIA